jgi:hypothetical protein
LIQVTFNAPHGVHLQEYSSMGAALQMALQAEKNDPEGLRCAVRFPLCLPVRLMAGGEVYEGRTENMSANGVLLRLDKILTPGQEVEFLVEIPRGAAGFQQSAAVHCAGRITRSYREDSVTYTAAVIDEYSFQ